MYYPSSGLFVVRVLRLRVECAEFENDKALSVIANQKMNDYLKELAELAEINELV